MKYLRKYNESIDPDLKQDIMDICLDIIDIGFDVSVNETGIGKYIYIRSNINNKFHINDELKEVLLRLCDFLGDLYVSCLVSRSEYQKKIELTEDFLYSEEVKNIGEVSNIFIILNFFKSDVVYKEIDFFLHTNEG